MPRRGGRNLTSLYYYSLPHPAIDALGLMACRELNQLPPGFSPSLFGSNKSQPENDETQNYQDDISDSPPPLEDADLDSSYPPPHPPFGITDSRTFPSFLQLTEEDCEDIFTPSELRQLAHGNFNTPLQEDFPKPYRRFHLPPTSGTQWTEVDVLHPELQYIVDIIGNDDKEEPKHVPETIENISYQSPLSISSTEMVNGYYLYNCEKPIIPYSEFVKVTDMFQDQTELSYEEFKEIFHQKVCVDWERMDEHGNCYQGFWKYPHHSMEYDLAGELTMDSNCRKLYALPFSKPFLLWTIDVGCSTRMECVRFSNFLGVWFTRKLDQMMTTTLD